MRTTYWTMWTREPARLQAELPEAQFLRTDRIQDGVAVFGLEIEDPSMAYTMRRVATQLVAQKIIFHFSRGALPPGPATCEHEPDDTLHHYVMDEWVVTDDRLHRIVNCFKADRCDVLWKYAEVDIMTFGDEQEARAELQRRVAVYQAQDAANYTALN